MHTYIHINIHTYKHTYIHTYIQTYIHSNILTEHTCTPTRYEEKLRKWQGEPLQSHGRRGGDERPDWFQRVGGGDSNAAQPGVSGDHFRHAVLQDLTCLRATCLCGAHAAYRDTTGTNTGLLSSRMVTGQSDDEGWGGIRWHVAFVQQGQRSGRFAGLGPNKWLRHHRQAVGCLLTFLCRPCSLATPMSPCPFANEGDCDPRFRVYGLWFYGLRVQRTSLVRAP